MVLFFIVYLTRNCLKQRYYDHRELLRKRWCPWATPGRSSRKKPPSRPEASRRRDGECSSRPSSVVVRYLAMQLPFKFVSIKTTPRKYVFFTVLLINNKTKCYYNNHPIVSVEYILVKIL
jgi:hypothetical protein